LVLARRLEIIDAAEDLDPSVGVNVKLEQLGPGITAVSLIPG
jgi:hypothetical protein